MASADANTQPQPQPMFWNHLWGWMRSIPRAALLSMVGPSLLCVFGYFGWRFYGAHNLDMAYYGLKKSNIHIPNQPAWLKNTKVLDEVYDTTGLAKLSVLDSQTPRALAQLFDAHPCVRRTHRVQKLAEGQVIVDLEYRMPAAIVFCQKKDETTGELRDGYFYPIDEDGVLLDTKNFTGEDVRNYIGICVDSTNGDAFDQNKLHIGKPIGDSRVEEAVKLCSMLSPIRDAAKIKRVYVYNYGRQGGKLKWLLEIDTTGPRILWGSSPGNEMLGEPLATNKFKQLIAAASDSKQWGQEFINLAGAQFVPQQP